MSFLNIIEAVTERLSEIDANPGNLIFDIASKRILFDAISKIRLPGFASISDKRSVTASIIFKKLMVVFSFYYTNIL